jgi:hypothetical protein
MPAVLVVQELLVTQLGQAQHQQEQAATTAEVVAVVQTMLLDVHHKAVDLAVAVLAVAGLEMEMLAQELQILEAEAEELAFVVEMDYQELAVAV